MILYVVEDDADIRELELYALQNSGFDARGFASADEFYAACEKRLPALVLLDIMLPGKDGLAVLKTLRADKRTRLVPVILVTAKGTELDKVKGLDSGADDYIVKPFGVMELVSRVKSLLRRTAPDTGGDLSFGDIVMDDGRHAVTAGGQSRELTFKEYELLKLLLSNPGLALSRDKLMNEVWSYDYEGESRTVDVHIKTLRQKLGSSGALIKTVRGVGYKLGV